MEHGGASIEPTGPEPQVEKSILDLPAIREQRQTLADLSQKIVKNIEDASARQRGRNHSQQSTECSRALLGSLNNKETSPGRRCAGTAATSPGSRRVPSGPMSVCVGSGAPGTPTRLRVLRQKMAELALESINVKIQSND